MVVIEPVPIPGTDGSESYTPLSGVEQIIGFNDIQVGQSVWATTGHISCQHIDVSEDTRISRWAIRRDHDFSSTPTVYFKHRIRRVSEESYLITFSDDFSRDANTDHGPYPMKSKMFRAPAYQEVFELV